MAPKTATPGSNNAAAPKKSRVPPEEKFWKRYSPHHEFPLSSITSVFVHGLVVAIVVVVGVLAAKIMKDDKPLDMEPISLAGGGGDPGGVEGGARNGVAPSPGPENVKSDPDQKPANTKIDQEKIEKAEVTPDKLPDPLDDPAQNRYIAEAGAAAQAVKGLSSDVRKQLFQGIARSKGQGGPGEGGGKGAGKGTGEGDLEGPGKGNISRRQKRVLRWTLMFNTINGDDYRRQLAALGATLAIPDPSGGYVVFENLTPPVRGQKKDLSSIKQIFWVDDKPDSVASLSGALGLQRRPPHIVAFFPIALEEKLARLEREYAGKNEDDIKETRFEIDPTSNEVRVKDQR